jgi:hypothetical protein
MTEPKHVIYLFVIFGKALKRDAKIYGTNELAPSRWRTALKKFGNRF